MTNREWLNSLPNEDFISWLLDSETIKLQTWDKNFVFYEPTPKLATFRESYTDTRIALKEWLNEERVM